MKDLDNRHWQIEGFSERMKKSEWQSILLDYRDDVIFNGVVRKLTAKDIGNGIVEVKKEKQ